jgi:hypothetical protein
MNENESPRDEETREVLKEETADLPGGDKVVVEENGSYVNEPGAKEKDEREVCDSPVAREETEDFKSEVILSNELITTKSFTEIMNVFDNQVKVIREAAVRKVNEIRS